MHMLFIGTWIFVAGFFAHEIVHPTPMSPECKAQWEKLPTNIYGDHYIPVGKTESDGFAH